MKELFPGVFKVKGRIATKNSVKGKSVYGEFRITIDDNEYRYWDAERSKACAAFKNGLKNL